MKSRLLVTALVSAVILGGTSPAFAADTSAPVVVDWKLLDLKTDIANGNGILRVQFSLSDESEIEQPLISLASTTTTQQTGFSFPGCL